MSQPDIRATSNFENLTAHTIPIAFHNLIVYWARKTVGADLFMRQEADKKGFKKPNRNLSIRRIIASINPNLQAPLFIVGAPRSGTTFLGDCIGVLSEYSYHFEPVATVAASRYVYHEQWSFEQAYLFYRLVYKWLMRIHLNGDLRFAEKSPDNCFLIPFLYECFPDAKFIHIIRDGRDVSLSNVRKPWLSSASNGSGLREPSGYLLGSHPRYWVEPERALEFQQTTDIHRCIWCWRRHVEAAFNHRSSLPSSQYLEVYYESLVTEPMLYTSKILDFLEIDKPDESKAIFQSALSKASQSSVGVWKQKLSSEQQNIINTEAGTLLKNLGYL
ncbi:sulfotransferase family protein [Limnoraphis robusta]|uniref:sulfotransferase family protein n=1 Tax=Limnoraphis robusta TaxID=1118279 RepID=UPI00069FBF62|nr:sulfotransferase [Limnoraphis robusta]